MNHQIITQIQQSINELELCIQRFFLSIAQKSTLQQQQQQQSTTSQYTFQQAKHDSTQISILLAKLEQLLDHSQLTFAMDHSKSHLLRVDADKTRIVGAYSEQFSHLMQHEVLEETNAEKKNLSTISQNAYNTMEQLRKLNDQLFVDFIDEEEDESIVNNNSNNNNNNMVD
jgi:hypothetical protein